jgi:predicted tellurium resistance membrane protein TerC
MDWLTSPDIWVALLTLTALEIVLGIDNIIFISILAGKLPVGQQARARTLGLGLAMGTRILLLLSLSWIIGLEEPLFDVFSRGFSGRDLILLGGGLFLLAKATYEIHEKLEGEESHGTTGRAAASFASVIFQILLLDIVFSLDSVITAVGMADDIGVMIAAVVIAIGVMLVSAGPISDFVNNHPTVKMLALSFLLLIGFSLVAEGFGQHIEKGYIYFAMGFSVFVEMLNLRLRGSRKTDPVELRPTYIKDPGAEGAVGHLGGRPLVPAAAGGAPSPDGRSVPSQPRAGRPSGATAAPRSRSGRKGGRRR